MGLKLLTCLIFGIALVHGAPKVADDLKINNNEKETSRSNEVSLEDHIENFVKKQDVSFDIPLLGSSLRMNARNLDSNQLDLKLRFGSESVVEERGKKHKVKKLQKLFVPILVFIIIKAMTLIPLALGVLGIKTWNAVQLAFISFVSSIAMAVWKLCSKINQEPPQVIHQAWDPHHYHDRSDNAGQQMAYSGYAPQQ